MQTNLLGRKVHGTFTRWSDKLGEWFQAKIEGATVVAVSADGEYLCVFVALEEDGRLVKINEPVLLPVDWQRSLR